MNITNILDTMLSKSRRRKILNLGRSIMQILLVFVITYNKNAPMNHATNTELTQPTKLTLNSMERGTIVKQAASRLIIAHLRTYIHIALLIRMNATRITSWRPLGYRETRLEMAPILIRSTAYRKNLTAAWRNMNRYTRNGTWTLIA